MSADQLRDAIRFIEDAIARRDETEMRAVFDEVARAALAPDLDEQLTVGDPGTEPEPDSVRIPVLWFGELVATVELCNLAAPFWQGYYLGPAIPMGSDDQEFEVWQAPELDQLDRVRAAVDPELVSRLSEDLRRKVAVNLRAWGEHYGELPLSALYR